MIIVTGANGFIGSAVVWALNESGRQDLLLTDYVTLEKQPQLLQARKYARFLDPDQLLKELQSGDHQNVEWIIHMGACSSTYETNWEYLKKVNVDYSKDIFSWCSEHQVPLIYASSAATYGDGSKGFDDRVASTGYESLNLYGKSKLVFDQWVENQDCAPTHWYGLRFFNVYGPHEYYKGEQASVAFKSFAQIQSEKKIRLFKSYHKDYRDGEQLRDFIYVKDICHWILELMEKKPQSGIYNMGVGQAQSWLDLAKACFRALDLEPKIEFIDMPEHLKPRYQYFTEANMEKWFSQGLSPVRWPLEKGVDDYYRSYLASDSVFL